MSIQLVIAEKPSVARSIAGVIGADKKQDGYFEGNGYLVSWCIGHLVSLADAGAYDERFKKWRYGDLPILPQEWQYIIPDEKKKQFEVLRSLMELPDVDGLVCATDAGARGNLFSVSSIRWRAVKSRSNVFGFPAWRTRPSWRAFSICAPAQTTDALYQSALCRARADWLVGINATRLFSILYHKTLTVGRVQTPTLKMLVDRESKIDNFKKEKYHVVHIAAGGMEAASERFSSADDADATKTACARAQAVCVSVKREKKTEQPPRLYDLTTLQREANRLFGFTAKQTLDYAQQLYEKKCLTYPRTDSQYLTDDMQPTAESIVSGLWPLLPFAAELDISPQFGRVLNSKKVSDHHAIVPTMEFVQRGFDGLAEGERGPMVFSADHNRKTASSPAGNRNQHRQSTGLFLYGYRSPQKRPIKLPRDMVLSAGMDELNFLAARLEKLDATELTELNAALTSPQSDFHNIGQIIDYPENVDFYVHLPDVTSTGQLGETNSFSSVLSGFSM